MTYGVRKAEHGGRSKEVSQVGLKYGSYKEGKGESKREISDVLNLILTE